LPKEKNKKLGFYCSALTRSRHCLSVRERFAMIIDECLILLIIKKTTNMKKIMISICCFIFLITIGCRQDEIIGVEMEENIEDDEFFVNVSGTT